MSVTREFKFPSSAEGRTVFATEWAPASPPVRAVVQAAHGVAEHIGRYAPLGEFLAGRGIVLVGADHIGHGRSAAGGQPGHFSDADGWAHAVRDQRTLRTLTGAAYPGVPYFLMGHSMGSFLIRTYLADYPDDALAGAILSGTGQEPPARVALGRALSGILGTVRGRQRTSKLLTALSLGAYNRQFAPNRTPSDWISRDEAVVDAYLADPYCRYASSTGMFHDMMGALKRLAAPETARQVNKALPLYFFSGASDPVGENGAGVKRVAAALRAAGCRDVTVRLYPGGRHEMLNEQNRQEVMDDLLSWLSQILSRPPAGDPPLRGD